MPKGIRRLKQDSIKTLKKELEKAPRPRMENVAQAFITCAGGEKNLGKLLFLDYEGSAPGSTVRKSIIQIIAYATKNAQEAFSADALDDMDEEDLQILFNRRLQELETPDEDPADEGPGPDQQEREQAGVGQEAAEGPSREGQGESRTPSVVDQDPAGGDDDWLAAPLETQQDRPF